MERDPVDVILSLCDGADAESLRSLAPSHKRRQCAGALMALAMRPEPDGNVDARKRMLLATLASELDATRADALLVAAEAACDAAFTGQGELDRYTIFAYSCFNKCAAHPHAPAELKASATRGATKARGVIEAKLRAFLKDGAAVDTIVKHGGGSPTKILQGVTQQAINSEFPDLMGLDTPLKTLVERAQGKFKHHVQVLNRASDIVQSATPDPSGEQLDAILRALLLSRLRFLSLGSWNMCAHSRKCGHGIPESLPAKVAALDRMAVEQQWSVVALQECPPRAAGGVQALLSALNDATTIRGWQRDGVTLQLSAADTERGMVLHDGRAWRRIGQAVTYPNPDGAFKRAPLLVALVSRAKPELALAVVSVHLKCRDGIDSGGGGGNDDDDDDDGDVGKGGSGAAQNTREIGALGHVAAWAREQVAAMAAADAVGSAATAGAGTPRHIAYAIIGDFNAPPTDPAFAALSSAGFAPVLRDTATNMSELLLGGVPAQYDNAWLCKEAWAGDTPWLAQPGGHAVLPFTQAQFNDFVKLLTGLRGLEGSLADKDVKAFAHSLVRTASQESTKIRSSDHKAISISCYHARASAAAAASATAAAPLVRDALAPATPPSHHTRAEGAAPLRTDGSSEPVRRAINFSKDAGDDGGGSGAAARASSPPQAAAAPPAALSASSTPLARSPATPPASVRGAPAGGSRRRSTTSGSKKKKA